MTGVMTQWMKDRLARQHEEARQEGLEEGRQEGRLKACREANAWARQARAEPTVPGCGGRPRRPMRPGSGASRNHPVAALSIQ